MISWEVFSALVNAAYSALRGHYEANQDAVKRAKEIRAMADCTQQAAQQVISTVITLRLAELKGRVEGYADRYASYTPGEPGGDDKLRELVDDAALTIGELGALVDLLQMDRELAFDAYAPYTQLLHLRAQAMVERELAYGVPEIADVRFSFENGIARAEMLLDRLRYEIYSRFTPPQREYCSSEKAEFRYVYKKDGVRKVLCDQLMDATCTPSFAYAKWDQDRRQTYEADPVVRIIDDSQGYLEGFLSAITPDVMRLHGKPVTMRGLLAPAPIRIDDRAANLPRRLPD